MYANKTVGKNKVIPVADRAELSEENIQVAAMAYASGAQMPLESESDREEMTKDTAKTKGARRRAIKFVHKQEEVKSEVAPPMDMYLRIKQMSLFPSIY